LHWPGAGKRGRAKGDIQDFALRGDILDVTFHRFGLARRLGLQCTLNPRGRPTKKENLECPLSSCRVPVPFLRAGPLFIASAWRVAWACNAPSTHVAGHQKKENLECPLSFGECP
jgi:hypothetical protein